MNYEMSIAVLNKLLIATKAGIATWREDEHGWFTTQVGDRAITFRFLYFEATNQIGADRYIIDFSMPGLNDRFACGTQGFCLILELLEAAFPSYRSEQRSSPLEFLDEHL